MSFYVHIIDEDANTMLTKRKMAGVPRVDDELRWGGEGHERYYRVIRVVWCLDEDHVAGQRINIAVVPIS